MLGAWPAWLQKWGQWGTQCRQMEVDRRGRRRVTAAVGAQVGVVVARGGAERRVNGRSSRRSRRSWRCCLSHAVMALADLRDERCEVEVPLVQTARPAGDPKGTHRSLRRGVMKAGEQQRMSDDVEGCRAMACAAGTMKQSQKNMVSFCNEQRQNLLGTATDSDAAPVHLRR